jgi:tryptophan halogenase
MTVPDSLACKIELFVEAGRVETYTKGLFLEPSWIAVYLGQGIVPKRWDPRADRPDTATLDRALAGLKRLIDATVQSAPDHAAMLAAAA